MGSDYVVTHTPLCEDKTPPIDDGSWQYTVNTNLQRRNLDDWCFVEHIQPTVILQVRVTKITRSSGEAFVCELKGRAFKSYLTVWAKS